MSVDRVGWGILGTGGIAARFVRDLAFVEDAVPLAVGSRAEATARRFADEHGVPRAYGSYEDLVADPDVDAVYVATPQTRHAADVRLALEAGKPVLCEKPFTMTAAEAREVIDLARLKGLFLMEAMWTRFLPHMRRIAELLADGALGEVTSVVADHGQYIPDDGKHRLHRPELGGGALLDLGVYPVSFASHVLGPPVRVSAAGTMLPSGLDEQTSMVLTYDSGAHAVLTTTLAARTSNRATISGTRARIEIGAVWYARGPIAVIGDGQDVIERYEHQHVGTGLWYQAAAVGELLRAGATESPLMPLDETIAVLEVLDDVRRQIGLTYPTLPESGHCGP